MGSSAQSKGDEWVVLATVVDEMLLVLCGLATMYKYR